ncbi:MAG: hypothetical protein F9K40_17595 [Kofleriaceae bacterium]|nr:MAG: hypothetical protein F9K40_17595 [Kofleriaceae bacterium]MBZ0236021.1 hypothetical protein [Kofleriaceae bacterium]
MRRRALLWAGGLAAATATAHADELGEPVEASVAIHGFVSQGFLYTSDNNYLADTEDGSFEFAEAGVNVTRQLGDELRVGMQLFARDLGPLGNYSAKLDWFYLDYRWRDWLGLRAGRLKLPFGLYNDSVDVDAVHPVALLPQSVYPARNRDFLLAQTGVELYGYHDLGALGALDYRAYGGTIFLDPGESSNPAVRLVALDIPYVIGARVLWEPPVEGLRIGASAQAARLESELLAPAPVSFDIDALFWVASVEYSADRLFVAGEYSRWHLDTTSSDQMLAPDRSTTSERAYVLAAFRVRPWLQPGGYYAVYFPDVAQREGKEGHQHDVAATLRFDITPHWLVKLEGHYLRGTADVAASLNPTGESNRWQMLVAKTTAYF